MAAQPQFPALTGRVVDEAGLLSREEADALARQLEALEERTSDQLVVVTLRSLQGFPIEDYGYKLGRHWGIGQAGKDNGVLLIVAPTERKVRIEVGRGLEGELPDALAKLIIENAILP
ncbi:MAG: TPM domain-containing protein, partial [Alphaproteobacteria bacterium]